MNSTTKFTYPLILISFVLGISSCASTPTSQKTDTNNRPNNTINSPSSPTPTSKPNIIPSDDDLPSNQLSPRSNQNENSNQVTPRDDSNSSSPPRDKKIAVAPTDVIGKTLGVTMYTSDPQCQKLVPKKVQVSAKNPAQNIVGQIIEQQDGGDFNLSGYRVNVKGNIATVDLRVSPNSKRQITSLSSCEQFALFGGLKKTLTSNSQLNIKEVRFTEKGEEIPL
ncbi:MAG: sporulation/spore germination protein [Cyanobacteria bacterium P01_A01_bin.84]